MSEATSRRGLLLPLLALLIAGGAAVFATVYDWGEPPLPADDVEARRTEDAQAAIGPLDAPPPETTDPKPDDAGDPAAPAEAPIAVPAPEGVVAPDGEGIVGILVDPDGNSLARARVSISRDLREAAMSDPGEITRTFRISSGGGFGFGREAGVTDRQGRFAIKKPGKDGKYNVTFKHPDYPSHQVPGVIWTGGSRVDLGVVRVPSGGVIFGFVRDEGGKPVSGARVQRSKAEGGNDPRTMVRSAVSIAVSGSDGEVISFGGTGGELTDAEGYFEMTKVPPGTYKLKAVVKGKADAVREGVVVVEGGRAGPISLTPSAGLEISGVVVDETGRPVPGARITSFRDGKVHSLRADDQGAFLLKGLSPGKVRLMVSGGGGGPFMGGGMSSSQEVEAGTSGVRLVLTKGLVLAGRLIDAATGNPVNRARISLVRSNEGTQSRTMTFAMNGAFRFQNQKPGEYTIEVTVKGYRKATEGPYTLVEGRSIEDILIRLQPE